MSRRSFSDFIDPPPPPKPVLGGRFVDPGKNQSPTPPPPPPTLPPVVRSGRLAPPVPTELGSRTPAGLTSINEFQAFAAATAEKPALASIDVSEPLVEEPDDSDEPWSVRKVWNLMVPYALSETPSWLVSLVVHVAIILLLALIPLSVEISRNISIIAGIGQDEVAGDELAVFEIQNDETVVTEMEDPTADLIEQSLSETPLETASEAISLLPDLSLALPIRNGLKGRKGAMKAALLKAYGGTAGTEDAVALGLEWLARNQKSDGSWSLVGPYREGGVNENKPAATAMALLAFMGAGNTHQDGKYFTRVRDGIAYLLKQQDREGFFASQSAGNQRTYAQAQCSIAVCELFGMTGDEELRKPAQLAVRYAEKAQSKGGGWRYQPRTDGDTSVTGWYVMALISARMSGLDVDSEVLERVHEFLNTVQRSGDSNQPEPEGELYAYQSYSKAVPSMTAEGMLCRLYLGWKTDDVRIQQGARHLAERVISAEDGRIAYYYWYYATTTLHHIGGPEWAQWNDVMKNALPALQIKTGKESGSWPIGSDPHASTGGKLYATCMALFCLESYYRHLPLSEMAPKPAK